MSWQYKVIGIDPAFANMGLVEAVLDMKGPKPSIEVVRMELVKTESQDRKTVRKSSDDLRRAIHLHRSLQDFIRSAGTVHMVFAEVPSGAQDAKAARALGIATGVLASVPGMIIEVAPIEIKRLFATKGPVSKQQVIDWAVKRWPAAPWLTHMGRRTLNNEHLADALATIEAGLQTPEFKQLMAWSAPALNAAPRARRTLL